MPERRTADSLLRSLEPALRGVLVTAARLERRRGNTMERTPFPTGVAAIDRSLGGGLPRGALVEFSGRGSSGRLSAALAAAAAATASGAAAAFVDRGGSLDPASAVRLGVALERLLWVLPERLPGAVRAAEEVLAARFPLVVIEAGLPPLPGRVPTAAWFRLARLALERGATVIVSSPYRLTGPAAGVVVRFRGRRGTWLGKGPRVLAGLEASIAIDRLRLAGNGAPVHGAAHRWTLPDAALADPAAAPGAAAGGESAGAIHAAG